MAGQLEKERRIFFPWEGRGTLRRLFARGRFLTVALVLLFAFIVRGVVARERHEAGVRTTLVALFEVRPWVERYLLDHEGQCPADLNEVARHVDAGQLPRDGWGRPLRLVCPTSRPGYDYVLMSDGPDGYPGGLDRIEN